MEQFSPKFNRLMFLSLLGTIVFIILYPKFPLLNVSGTYVAIRIEDLLILSISLIWLSINLKNLKIILNQSLTQAFLLFWFIGLLSVLSGYLISHTLSLHLGLLHWLRRVEMMMLFLVASTTITNTQQLKTIFKTLLVVSVIVIIYGLGQIFLQFPVVSTTNKEFSKGLLLKLTPDARPNSTFAGHYDLAIYLSVIIIFIGSCFSLYKTLKQKIILSLVGVVSFLLLGFTAARISFAGTLIGLSFIFWLNGKKKLILALAVLAVVIVGVIPELRHRLVATFTVNILQGGGEKYTPEEDAVNVFTPGADIPESSRAAIIQKQIEDSTKSGKQSSTSADIAPGEPINTTELGVFRSYNIRLNVEWPRAQRAIIKNPILGTGYSSISLATDNDFLRSLGETGFLGTLGLGLIFWLIFSQLFRSLKDLRGIGRVFVLATICGSLCIGLTAIFIDVLEASKIAAIFWVMLGIAWGIVHNFKYDDQD